MPKYYRNLLVFSIMITVLPIIVWSIFSYYQSSAYIIQKFSDQNKQTLSQSQLKVEQTLETADYAVTQFLTSPLSHWFNRPLTTSDFSGINALQQELLKLRIDRLGITGFVLMNKEHDWIISNKGFFRFEQTADSVLYDQYKGLPYTSAWVVEGASGSQSVRLVKKVPILTNTTDPKGFLILSISETKIYQLLVEDVEVNDLYIFDREGHLIASNDTASNEMETQELIALVQQQNPGAGDMITRIGNSKKIINYRQSSYNNWVYVSTFSLDAATNDLRSMAWVTVLHSSIILFLLVIIVVMGTGKIYNPIRKIYQLSNQRLFANTKEEKDELLSIEKHINTLIKTESNLNEQLEKQSKYVRDTFLLKLLLGHPVTSGMDNMELKAEYPWRWYAVISLQVDSLEIKKYSRKDQNLILFAIGNITSELISPSQQLGTFVLDQTQVTVLTGDQESKGEFKNHVNHLANLVKNLVFSYLKMEVSIGVGGIYNEIRQISQSHKESMEALKYRIRLGSNVILHLDEIIDSNNSAAQQCQYPHHLESKLHQAIKGMDKEESRRLLQQFMKEIKDKNVAYEEFQLIILQLFASIVRIIRDYEQPTHEIIGQRLSVEQLLTLHSENEIEDWLHDTVISPIIAYLEKQALTNTGNPTEKIIQIIHQECESELSLEYCAAQVNFHPNYVSRVFKKETGVSFSEYLANYRLKMAEQYLIETELTISDISDKFKYNSSAAFIRYFRKMKGMTPGEFRKKHKKAK